MHALINRGLQNYLRNTQGEEFWNTLAWGEGLDPEGLEVVMSQDVAMPYRLLESAAQLLDRSCHDLLEDFGIYMISHPAAVAVRRLMRFSGRDFNDFLGALPDMRPRVLMAIPDLVLPKIDVVEIEGGVEIGIANTLPGFEFILMGLVRAMADDYGSLARIEAVDDPSLANWADLQCLRVMVVDNGFSSGRDFSLVEAG